MRFVAVDWSGAEPDTGRATWTAAVEDGELVLLDNGLSRPDVVARIIAMAARDADLVCGLDFAFSTPRWFVERCGCRTGPEFWEAVADSGEHWLATCPPPFWGRPSRPRAAGPGLGTPLRRTDTGGARSVFQVGGAGSVGTGSLRGMPLLRRLRGAGFAAWPFDPPRLPIAVEVYPRRLTGPVVKSSRPAREAYLDALGWPASPSLRQAAASREDAFDAAVSALRMWERRAELLALPDRSADPVALAEGEIWPAAY